MTDDQRQCVILVGGRGTRLGALTDAVPKPLLPVTGRPFLDYLVFEVRRHGFTRVTLLAGYRGEALTNAASAMERAYPDITIEVLIEPEPLGTGGALRFAADRLASEFLLMNGDSLFDFNYLDLAARAVSGEWAARLALVPGRDAARYGSVVLEGDRVVRFAEKTPISAVATINGGVYWMKRSVVDQVGPGNVSLERDVFPRLAEKGLLRGFAYDRFMLDIGVPESLAAASTLIPKQTRRAAVFFDRDGVLNVDHGYVHRRDQFEWIEGAVESVKAVNDSGKFAFVVTNQAGVGRGYYQEADVTALHAWMNRELARHGAHIDAFAYCPHHPEATVERYRRMCTCRKPSPGMIEGLIGRWPVDRAACLLIGDRETDLAAAAAAGIPARQFHGGDLRDMLGAWARA